MNIATQLNGENVTVVYMNNNGHDLFITYIKENGELTVQKLYNNPASLINTVTTSAEIIPTSGVTVTPTGPQWTSVTVTTSAYSAQKNKIILCDTTAGNITITLPPAAPNINEEIVINKISSDLNLVIVACSGPDLLNGLASRNLEYQYSSISVISDGTNWWIR